MINLQWLELPMARTNVHGLKDVQVIEVQVYMVMVFKVLTSNLVAVGVFPQFPESFSIFMTAVRLFRSCHIGGFSGCRGYTRAPPL